MNRRAHALISGAQALIAQGHFEAALEALKPMVGSADGCREAKLEALALSAAACNHLSWYHEEIELRRARLALIREGGAAEANERALLASAFTVLGDFGAAQETIAPLTPGCGRREWAQALRVKALIVLRRDRDYEHAGELVREAVTLLARDGDNFGRGRLRVLEGIILCLRARPKAAVAALRGGQRILVKLIHEHPPALFEYAKAEFFLGDVNFMGGNNRGALACYEKARQLLGRRATAHFVKRYFLRLGQVYYALGDLARARGHFLHPELLAAVEKLGNLEGYFWCYMGAAVSSLTAGAFEQAAQSLAEAEKCVRPHPTPFIQAYIRLAQGHLALAQKMLPEAEAAYREAQHLFARVGASGFLQGMSTCLACRGDVEVKRGNTKGLLAVLKECAKLAAASGHADLRVNALLLESAALAEGAKNEDKRFRDIFDQLDLIASPVTMFRVVSNLYHYARKFANYTLDVEIEKRIQALKNALAGGTYLALYRECVDRRYTARIMAAVRVEEEGP
ncbi:MAG: hypothetical protein GYA73_09495, partial [Planctomycetes bacterium]|nr:hypothetical protein [Planctomycetota bacterium]